MKSGKQRRREIKQARARRRREPAEADARVDALGSAPCNPDKLAPYNSYGEPAFVTRGFYLDRPFVCVDCGVEEVWRATQQKWWYEVAGGHVETTANRCRACRRRARRRKAEARRVSEAGRVRKLARLKPD